MVRSRRQARCQPPRTERDKKWDSYSTRLIVIQSESSISKAQQSPLPQITALCKSQWPHGAQSILRGQAIAEVCTLYQRVLLICDQIPVRHEEKRQKYQRQNNRSGPKKYLDSSPQHNSLVNTTFRLLHVSGTWLNIWFVHHSPGLQRWVEAVCFSIWQRHHSYTLLGQKRLTNCGVCAWSEREIRYNISIDLR